MLRHIEGDTFQAPWGSDGQPAVSGSLIYERMPGPQLLGGILEVAPSLSATSLGRYLLLVSVRKASQLCETLVSGQARSGSALKSLNSSVPGSCLKTRVGVSHYTKYIRVHTKAAQGEFSAVCFTGEMIHLGLAGPDLALNWEEAVQHLPITPPGTHTAASSKNWMRRWGSRPCSLSCPSPSPP